MKFYIMNCAFSCVRRLLNSFVLICFFWSTLFQTLVFADFTRALPEAAVIENGIGDLKFLRFGIKIENLDYESSEGFISDSLPPSNFLRIPMGPSNQAMQTAIHDLYKNSIYQNLTVLDDGLSWSSFGLDFTLHNSGHLRVKRDKDKTHTNSTTSFRNLRLVNPHGAIFFEDELSFDHLILETKDVVQYGTLSLHTLDATIDGHFINKGSLSLVHTLFHKPNAHNDTHTLTTFLNTKEGHLIGGDNTLTIEGHCVFKNEGGLHVKKAHFDNTIIENSGTVQQINQQPSHIIECGENVQSFTNTADGVLNTDHFINRSQSSTNAGEMTINTWDQRGKSFTNKEDATITVTGISTLEGETIANDGTLIFNDQLHGFIANFTNTGSFITKGDTVVNGDSFSNTGKMKLYNTFSYNGRQFVSTDQSSIEAKNHLTIATVVPLVLRGKIFIGSDLSKQKPNPEIINASFTAPSIENYATTLRNEKGTVILNGTFVNHADFDMDKVDFQGDSLTNHGKVQANVVSSVPLKEFNNKGTFISRSGHMSAEQTKNTGTLLVASGQYSVGVLTNARDAFFILDKGAKVTVRDILNRGVIQSKTHLTIDSLRNMTELGVVMADGSLIIKSTTIPKEIDWVDEFLAKNFNESVGNIRIKKDEHLIIDVERFINRQNLRIPYHVRVLTNQFVNHQKIATRGLSIQTGTFQNGSDNAHMGIIHSYGPLTITAQGDIDNRFGEIKASQKARFVCTRGILNNGAPVTETIQETITNQNTSITRALTLKKRNKALIVSNEQVFMESEQGIDNAFGILFGGHGIMLKTGHHINNVSGSILVGCDNTSSSSQQKSQNTALHIEARNVINSVGPLQETEEGFLGPQWNRMPFPIQNPNYGKSVHRKEQYTESEGGLIKNCNGPIVMDVSQVMNKGSSILSPTSITINGIVVRKNQPYPSLVEAEEVPLWAFYTVYQMTYNRQNQYVKAAGPVANTSTLHNQPWKTIPQLILGGKEILLKTENLIFSGSLNAPIVTINANIFQGLRPFIKQDRYTGNTIVDIGKAALHSASNNPLLLSNEHGIRLNTLIQERVRFFNTLNTPSRFSLDPMKSLYNFLSDDVLRYTMLHVLPAVTGSLNLYGRSGNTLIDYLHDLGHQVGPNLTGIKITENGVITPNAISTLKDGGLVYVPHTYKGQMFQWPLLVVTPNMITDLARGTISANQLNVNIKNDMSLDRTIFAAYDIKESEADKLRRSVPNVETTREDYNQKDKATLNIHVGGKIEAIAPGIISQGNAHVTAGNGASILATTEREYCCNGTTERPIQPIFQAETEFKLDVIGDLMVQALKASSTSADAKTDFLFNATGNIFDIPLMVKSTRSYYEVHKRGYTHVQEEWLNAVTSNYTTKGDVAFNSEGQIDSYAPYVRAAKCDLTANGPITLHGVQNTHTSQTNDYREGRGLFGKDTYTQIAAQDVRTFGADLGDTPTTLTSRFGDVNMTAIRATNLTINVSPESMVNFFLGRNYSSYQQATQSSNMFLQSQAFHSDEHHTFTQSEIGKIFFNHADAVNIESIRGQTAAYLDRIKEHYHGVINQTFLDEIHNEVNIKQSGPTAAFAALIAIAATVASFGAASHFGGMVAGATGGVSTTTGIAATGVGATNAAAAGAAMAGQTVLSGSALAGASFATGVSAGVSGTAAAGFSATALTLTTAGSITSAVCTAGFTTICAQTAVSAITNKLNLTKTIESLTSKDTLKSLGISMVTAGITKYLFGELKIPLQSNDLSDHLKKSVLKTGVDAGVGVIFNGSINEGSLLRSFGANTVSSYLASEIGNAYTDPQIELDAFSHKILHTTVGALSGAILNSDGKPLEGAAAGALGAFVAETFADMFKPEKPTLEKIAAYENEFGRRLTEAEFNTFYAKEMALYDAGVERTHDFARLTAATTALLTGIDVNIADRFGTSALDHNFIILAYTGVMTASALWSGYNIYKGYQNGGFYGALKVIGIELSCLAAGGVIVKVSAPYIKTAIQLVLAKNPGLEIMLGVFVDRLAIETERFLATNAGKSLQATVAALERPIAQGMQKIAIGVAKAETSLVNSYEKASKAFNKVRGKSAGQSTSFAEGKLSSNQIQVYAKELEVAESKFWTRHETHELLGKTNKVYKRDDLIDLNKVDSKGRTNLELMKRGQPPIGPDNLPINLHHMIQTEKGAMAEVTQTFHQKYSKIIHINNNSIPSGIDRVAFGKWRSEYWQQRAAELTGGFK